MKLGDLASIPNESIVLDETLEALFQASRESHAENDRFLDDSASGAEQVSRNQAVDPAPCPEGTYVVVTDAAGQLGFEFV